MQLEDITSLLNGGHVRRWAQDFVLLEKKKSNILHPSPWKCSFLVCASGDFFSSKLLWTRNLIAHTVSTHARTHTRAQRTRPHTQARTSYELSTRIDTQRARTHARLPLCNSPPRSLKVLKMFSASSPPVCASSRHILPSSPSSNPAHPSLSPTSTLHPPPPPPPNVSSSVVFWGAGTGVSPGKQAELRWELSRRPFSCVSVF